MRKKFVCSNPDCRQFGIPVRNTWNGRCNRCRVELITNQEYHQWFESMDITNRPVDKSRNGKVLTAKPEVKSDGLVFTCESTLSGCPIAASEPVKVLMPFTLYNECHWLTKQFNTEWLAYLQGKLEADGSYSIEPGLYFPKQTATTAHVTVSDGERPPEGSIAAIHSHVDFGVFFSKEDEDHFNHPVEMIINRKGDVIANALSTLKCGSLHRGPATVLLTGAPTESKAKLQEMLVVTSYTNKATSQWEDRPYQFNYIKH